MAESNVKEDSAEWVSVGAKPKANQGAIKGGGSAQKNQKAQQNKNEKWTRRNKQESKSKPPKKQKQAMQNKGGVNSGIRTSKKSKQLEKRQQDEPQKVLLRPSDFPSLSSSSDFPALAVENVTSADKQPTWLPNTQQQPPSPATGQKRVSQEPSRKGVPPRKQHPKPRKGAKQSKQKQNQVAKEKGNDASTPLLRPDVFPSLTTNDFPSLTSAAFSKPQPPKPKPTTFAKKPTTLPATKKPAKQPSPKSKASKGNSRATTAVQTQLSPAQRASFLSPPMPGPPRLDGGEHDLLRLMQEGKMVVQKKGRQRIRPRKKKFSALKKKVLEERLRRWQELHSPESGSTGEDPAAKTSTVRLEGYVDPDELEDDDEYEEICDNLREMAAKVGVVKHVFIPRSVEGSDVPAFVDFIEANHAGAAMECWNGLVLGGSVLNARLQTTESPAPEGLDEWQEWCVTPQAADASGDDEACDTIVEVSLGNALTEDDFEDEECMEESLADIKALASEFGTLESHRVEQEPNPCVVLSYRCTKKEAREIAATLSKKVMGGSLLAATVLADAVNKTASTVENVLILRNVLTDDDIEDEDCLEESLNDLRELAVQFGSIDKIDADTSARTVSISFCSGEDTKKAVEAFNGMVIGGTTVSASLPMNDAVMTYTNVASAAESIDPKEEENKPMFSGDKIIPERFAECKRAPKIPNSGKPRTYAVISEDETVKPLLSEMLSELMRLQRRAVEDKNAKARRRLVMGLREVARGIRARKVRMVVMANNLDDYGVLDEKLQEILDLAMKEEVPVFFEFSKRALGKAIGKSIKIAVVGIQNCDGANQQFKKLSNLALKLPSSTD